MPGKRPIPSVFISYSSRDRGFVEQLAGDLRRYGIKTWLDRWEMVPGDSLIQKIGGAILEAEYFIVILSPYSVESEWVNRELAVALQREFRERQVQVIPALIDDCVIPPFLQDKLYADFRGDRREGLGQLLRAINYPYIDEHIAALRSAGMNAPASSLPDGPVVQDNIVRENVITSNIADTHPPSRNLGAT